MPDTKPNKLAMWTGVIIGCILVWAVAIIAIIAIIKGAIWMFS